ncbi:hypothetical protein CHU95_21495 [Niveispirillum lacus]|uniref:diguanylate cyclase n=1 Tax=Niveispirillum lacus TaxID=1981099 RepID=A0A255YR85_9PROT|nr:GGDEF domain-containing protein [Niveispirillum lacus]OYQ31712.1 hypothetical protein CHU95_21495 [Niveispirillum lacus]
MMLLDLTSLCLANSMLTGVSALVLLCMRWQQAQMQGVGCWSMGQAAYSGGFLLLLLVDADPGPHAALPGFFVIFTGSLLTSFGLLRFFQAAGTTARRFLAVAASIVWTLLVIAMLIWDTTGPVLTLMPAIQILVSVTNILVLWHFGRGALRPPALALAIVFTLWALFCVVRLGFILVHGADTSVAMATLPSAVLVSTLVLTCHALGLVWLVVGRMQQHLLTQALTDPLTHALNRRGLEERGREHQSLAGRGGPPFALVTFDLDHFKLLNDTHGHMVGDTVLVRVVETVRQQLRPSDLVARLGGEEFCLLLPGSADTAAIAVADRIRRGIADLVIPSVTGPVSVTASFGVAWYGPHGKDWQTLLGAADQALYQAKHNGRNRVETARIDLVTPAVTLRLIGSR